MSRRHNSFVLRCWDIGGDEERAEIEHVQSGDRVLVLSLQTAVSWLEARCGLPESDSHAVFNEHGLEAVGARKGQLRD